MATYHIVFQYRVCLITKWKRNLQIATGSYSSPLSAQSPLISLHSFHPMFEHSCEHLPDGTDMQWFMHRGIVMLEQLKESVMLQHINIFVLLTKLRNCG